MAVEKKKILVTGGLGYIGSHTAIELVTRGYHVILLDNLSNSRLEALNRIRQIIEEERKSRAAAESAAWTSPEFVEGDIRDTAVLDSIFERGIDAVLHFAGLKAVGESVSKPLAYYDNNVSGLLVLLAAMEKHQVDRLIFSSSATVYGEAPCPIAETCPLGVTFNPYARTKMMCEHILQDYWAAQKDSRPTTSVGILRYFNPVGAHASGLIGEDPLGIPNNLVPFITRVVAGKLPHLTIFGTDWPTADGTCLRDYIHVVDLAVGHVHMLEKTLQQGGLFTYNLGTGSATSVLEMVAAFNSKIESPVKVVVGPRRAGDICQSFADPSKAERELGWKATRTLSEMVRDTLNWVAKNPHGLSLLSTI